MSANILSLERKINETLKSPLWDRELKNSTPSLQLSVFVKGQQQARVNWGKEYVFYDWASITKISFTVSIFMKLVSEKRLRLNDPLQRWLPWYPYKNVSVRQVLSHCAGYVDWFPFYQKLDLSLDVSLRLEQLKKLLREQKRSGRNTAVYSDLDFLLLRYVLESVCEAPLLKIFEDNKQELQLGRAHFAVNNQPLFPRSNYAPTEKCSWRKKIMQGEVHDENAWSLSGVSSHAGLFGRLEDLETWALGLRNRAFVSPKVRDEFLRRQMPSRRGDWAVGFMLPTVGHSTSGNYMSPTSVGHTGFVGNSFWWDRKLDIMIFILSNRVHPTRANRNFVKLRPRLHDLIMKNFV